jgi:catechol 2,3-dioxygenase-like lactoylglutathione lyase family enzyme
MNLGPGGLRANLGPNFVFGAVIHRVRDIKRSLEWYEERLGLIAFDLHDKDPNDTHALFAIGSTILTLWQARPGEEIGPTGAIGSTHVVWLVQGLDAVHADLTERGVNPQPIFEYGRFRQFYMFDPDGNRIEVAEVAGPLPWENGGSGGNGGGNGNVSESG